MGLSDLIVDQRQISEEMIENLLKGNVELIKEDSGVRLMPAVSKFTAATKVLLILAAKKAWEMISKTPHPTTASEIEGATGLPLNTIYPVMKKFNDDRLAISSKGKYSITNRGILQLPALIDADKNRSHTNKTSNTAGKVTRNRPSGRPDIIKAIKEHHMEPQYVETILPILEKSRHSDKYLLAIYIAKDKMAIDGLTSSEIQYLLNEAPLKLPKLYSSNISRDLPKLRNFTTPYPAGSSYEYRLTSLGERRVKELIEGGSTNVHQA